MNTDTKLDKYGLKPEDEFFGVNLVQVSDDGVVEVKPFTNALMTWWKCRMNQEDTINISEDGNHSILKCEVTLNGSELETDSFTSNDELEVDSVIEVSEDTGLLNMYIYIPKTLTTEMAVNLSISLMNLNPELDYGHFEIYTPNDSDQHYLRFRENVILKGINNGKVDAVENLYNFSFAYFSIGINGLCKTNKSFRKWLLE